jgi:hypothetical protein
MSPRVSSFRCPTATEALRPTKIDARSMRVSDTEQTKWPAPPYAASTGPNAHPGQGPQQGQAIIPRLATLLFEWRGE